MITVIARLKVQSGSETAFREAADKMIAHVRANEPGTVAYTLNRSTGDPTVFVFYEAYVDHTALGAHGETDAMREFFGTVGGMLEGPPDIQIYEELSGKR